MNKAQPAAGDCDLVHEPGEPVGRRQREDHARNQAVPDRKVTPGGVEPYTARRPTRPGRSPGRARPGIREVRNPARASPSSAMANKGGVTAVRNTLSIRVVAMPYASSVVWSGGSGRSRSRPMGSDRGARPNTRAIPGLVPNPPLMAM